MTDIIETIGNSTIQHGKHNDRVYIMKLDTRDLPGIVDHVEKLADEKGYSKIFGKIPEPAGNLFDERGYSREAVIPSFFNGEIDVLFMSMFLDADRNRDTKGEEIASVLANAKKKEATGYTPETFDHMRFEQCSQRNLDDMADLYREVFETYPFPIDNPDYIKQTMINDVVYFGSWLKGDLVGLSSAEMDRMNKNVEMTDFAVLPDYRGKNIAVHLLNLMEREMEERFLTMSYTIARSLSYGMNITFAKLGYVYAGTLVNNTNISGQIESMNVWYKPL